MPTFIADLPPELLQHIFSFYVERWHRNILTSEEAAEWDTTLMSVCQLWKKLVLSHPALWAYIPLPFPPARMSTHLERSADHPLTVFTPAASRYGYMEVFSPATVYLLAKCMDRLEALSVRTGMNNLRLLLERQSVAPLLKSLVLDTGTDTLPSTTIDSQAISFVSSCCPNLTRLHICWPTPFPEIEFPVGLRTLDLRATGSGEFPIERLAPLRNLTHLTLKGTYVPYARLNEPGEPEEADAFVDLPSLKTLRMGDSSFFTIGRTLARLEIPPLLNLSIVNGRLSYRDKYAADELDEICETFSWMSQMIDGATDALVLSFAGTTLNLDWKRTWSDESEPSVVRLFHGREALQRRQRCYKQISARAHLSSIQI
ncbi:hypothetical protein DL96DRAFT_487693 [Flagelloscypha sp. PMI_526]|nr:hypothetical protein DL96DRAFT_487693 [Flagelloscypha sp. PMI_526]